jgi:hypothetical protein
MGVISASAILHLLGFFAVVAAVRLGAHFKPWRYLVRRFSNGT